MQKFGILPANGLQWIFGILFGILVISLLPKKYGWLVVLWLTLSGLFVFERLKARGPIESLEAINTYKIS